MKRKAKPKKGLKKKKAKGSDEDDKDSKDDSKGQEEQKPLDGPYIFCEEKYLSSEVFNFTEVKIMVDEVRFTPNNSTAL